MLATADFPASDLPPNVTQTLGLLGNVLVMDVVFETHAFRRGLDFIDLLR